MSKELLTTTINRILYLSFTTFVPLGWSSQFKQTRNKIREGFYFWARKNKTMGKKLPLWLREQSACNAGDPGLIPGVRKIPWRREWQLTPGFLPGKSHGWRNLVGYSPSGRKESGMTE